MPVDYVTAQNEPTCCARLPVDELERLRPGLLHQERPAARRCQAAGLTTKVLAHDWNWDTYDTYAAPTVDDAAIRNDPNFGGIAWHGYGGDVAKQTHGAQPVPGRRRLRAPSTPAAPGSPTSSSEDMLNIIDYTRNWAKSVTKWSLAVDQNMGPHNGGCGTCTGLITVHNGDSRSGQVDYTVEYYTMGHLTKFVKPGRATGSTPRANSAVPNVAWRNPDGSKALIAYNDGGVRPAGHGQLGRPVVHVHAARPAPRRRSPGPGRSRAADGHVGRDRPASAASASTRGRTGANGTRGPALRLHRRRRQQWTVQADGSGPGARQVPGRRRRARRPTARRSSCTTATAPAAQQWTYNAADG